MVQFIPRRQKFNYNFKVIPKGFKTPRRSRLINGDIGLQAREAGFISAIQMEAIRRVLVRFLRPYKGKFYLYMFAWLPTTKKPIETRMGKGKGSLDKWVQPVNSGTILLELSNVSKHDGTRACQLVSHLLGFSVGVVT